jgi:N4-gp56 family major capsid protein
MAIDVFIPEVWSNRLRRHLDRTLVYAQPRCANRSYEGEITQAGDTVHIQQPTDPTILDYVPGNDMDAPQRPDGTTQALTVDKFKAFNIAIDDVNAAQVNVPLLDAFARRAGVKLAQSEDAYAAKQIVNADTVNVVGSDATPITVDDTGSGSNYTPYKLAVDLRRQLANQNAPMTDLWMVISPDFEAEILKDPNYVNSSSELGAGTVRNGQIGQLAGFAVLRTTGVPTSDGSGSSPAANWKLICGDGNYAFTWASQLTKTEAYRIERQFGDAVKGLDVFGAKVIEPATLAVAHIAS